MDWKKVWRLYWVEVKSLPEVCRELGCSLSTLYKRLEEWDFPTRTRGPGGSNRGKLTDIDLKELIADLEAGMTQVDAAAKYDISKQRVNQIARGYRRAV